MKESLIVSASGIRGVVGEGLTPEVGARYGAAFGSWARDRAGGRRGAVLVGRDSRTSGEMMLDAVSAGIRSVGVDVLDLGVVATPTGLLAVEESDEALGGLLVTASHNPAEWNGLKLVAPEGRFLTPEDGRDVERRFRDGVVGAAWDAVGSRTALAGANERHVARVLALPIIDPDLVASRDFLVALDCVRGAGAFTMLPLLEALGCRVVGIDLEPDGRFPRPPEPIPENLGRLGELVRREGADLGLAVDPDVDRLALVDATGTPVGEDWTLALAVELVGAAEPGPVVTNLSSSRTIQDAADRVGVPFHRAPVGEANVVARMREVGATIGGEGNGGVIYPALHLTRDAPLAAALILQLLARTQLPLGQIVRDRPGYRIVKQKVERGGLAVPELLRKLHDSAPKGVAGDTQDGIRLDWPDGAWVHVRPSGTEPILRIVAEAQQDERAGELADWVRMLVLPM
ncbi:MAG: phosphoglucosamine mutase [Gemmatimonadota bacterium]|nr:phosphoglucosamine mutase [Gemmatimonadota bacterium]